MTARCRSSHALIYLQALHAEDVVKLLRAEALLASGETADSVNAAADTVVGLQKRMQTRLRDTTAKVEG